MSFQTLPLRVSKESQAGCPRGALQLWAFRSCAVDTVLLWAVTSRLSAFFPPLSLPVLHPVSFLPWAGPEPGSEGRELWLGSPCLSQVGGAWERDIPGPGPSLLDPTCSEVLCCRADGFWWVHVYMCAHIHVHMTVVTQSLQDRSPFAGWSFPTPPHPPERF